ncbi:MAG: hypothetical protein U0796_19130 [Gemmatales bacterium]
MTEETLFELVLRTPEVERAALLDRACEGKLELRARVEALLKADARSSPLSMPSRVQVPPRRSCCTNEVITRWKPRLLYTMRI